MLCRCWVNLTASKCGLGNDPLDSIIFEEIEWSKFRLYFKKNLQYGMSVGLKDLARTELQESMFFTS
jgi:hypothetical protein